MPGNKKLRFLTFAFGFVSVFFLLGGRASANPASAYMPHNTYGIVSTANGPGSYYSPSSISYMYVPTTQPTASLRLVTEIGVLSNMSIGIPPSCVPPVEGGGGAVVNPGPGSQINISNTANAHPSRQITNGGVTYNIYCVAVYAANTGNNYFRLYTPTPGALIGVYPGPVDSLGTGFASTTSIQGYIPGGEWNQHITFSPPCGVTNGAADIFLYDLDMYTTTNGIEMNPHLRVRLLRTPKPGVGGAATYLALTGNLTANPSSGTYKPNTNASLGDNNFDNVVDGTSNTRPAWRVNIANGVRYNSNYTYRLEVNGIRNTNLIRINLPYDQINSSINCAVDRPPSITVSTGSSADCNNRRVVINVSDPDHSGNSTFNIQRQVRHYDYNTSTWSAWSSWATISHSAGATRTQRYYAISAGSDFTLYQFRFRTQGLAPPGAPTPGYVYSDYMYYGPCVRAYCSLAAAPSVFYVNEPNIVTIRVYNTGSNNGRTWQLNEGYQLRQISPTPVAIVSRLNTGSTVAPGSYRDFNVSITPTSVGSGAASYTWQFSRTSTLIGASCTMNRSVIYRPPAADCTINPPPIVEEGTSGTMSMTVRFTGPSNASPTGSVTAAALGGNGATPRGPSSPALPAAINRGGSVDFDYNNFPFGNAGSATWNGSVTVTTPNGIGGDHSVNATCTRSSVVGVFPYLKEFGGDVWAGGNFINMEPSDCSPPSGSGGGIYAHNTNTNSVSSGRYVGSSAQLTVTSLLTINQFSSAGNRDENVPSGNTYSPRGLTFANNNASNTYGGGYGAAETRCITDYYNDTRDTSLGTGPFTSNLPNNAGRIQYVYNGSVINPSGALTVPNGTQAAVFVAGDVLIRNNIIYSTGANSIGQIPNFTLVVCGDIYIHSSVDRLDGLYIAQPGNVDANGRCVRDSTSTNGTIYTCATSVNNACNQNNVFSEGTNQLSINGGLIANRIKWLRIRSGASLREAEFGETPSFATGAGTNASEVINFTPQMYLAPSGLADPGTTTGGGNSEQGTSEPYDSIRSLPPVF